MPKSQTLLISIHRKCQIWIDIFIIIHFFISFFCSHFLFAVSCRSCALSPEFVLCASRYLFVFLRFLSCESVCVGHNWLHGSSGSLLTQDDGRRTGGGGSFSSLFLLPLPSVFLIPLSRLQGIHQESQMISLKVSLQQMFLLRTPRTFTLCRQKVRRINQAVVRTSSSRGRENRVCQWSLLIST